MHWVATGSDTESDNEGIAPDDPTYCPSSSSDELSGTEDHTLPGPTPSTPNSTTLSPNPRTAKHITTPPRPNQFADKRRRKEPVFCLACLTPAIAWSQRPQQDSAEADQTPQRNRGNRMQRTPSNEATERRAQRAAIKKITPKGDECANIMISAIRHVELHGTLPFKDDAVVHRTSDQRQQVR